MKGLEDYPRPSAMSERDLLRGYGLTPVPWSGERPVSTSAHDADLQDAPSTEEPDEAEWPDPDIEYDRWRDNLLTDPPMA